MCDGFAEMMMMFNTIMASGYRIIAGERRWAIAIVDVDAYFYDSERLRIDSSVRKSSSSNPTFVGGHPLHKMTARQRGAADRTHAWSGPGLATDDDCDDGEEVSWVGCTENIDLHYTSNTIGILSVNIARSWTHLQHIRSVTERKHWFVSKDCEATQSGGG